MIKKMSVWVILITIVLLALSACGKRSVPFAPYDATPTPAPPLRVEITLSDSGIPAANVYMTIDAVSGTTNATGYLLVTLNGYGNHQLIIPNDIDHGFTNPLTYSINVTKDWASIVIDRGKPTISMVMDPKSANIFTCIKHTIIYHLKYSTPQKKKLDLEVDGLPGAFQWQFVPPFVENDGDTSTLTITTPKYYLVGYYFAPLTFTAWGQIGVAEKYPAGDTVNGYTLYQGWNFRLKDQNINNEIPIRYFVMTDFPMGSLPYNGSNIGYFDLTISVNTNNTNISDGAIVDHTNFPTTFPIKARILPASVPGLPLSSVQIYTSLYGNTNNWSYLNCFAYINGTALGTVTTPYVPAEPTDIYNGAIYTIYQRFYSSIWNYLDSTHITKVKFQMQFYNDDGFSMTVTARTDFTF